MQWLRQHGVIATYDDYVALPLAVLEDCRMLMEHEAMLAERERAAARAGGRR